LQGARHYPSILPALVGAGLNPLTNVCYVILQSF